MNTPKMNDNFKEMLEEICRLDPISEEERKIYNDKNPIRESDLDLDWMSNEDFLNLIESISPKVNYDSSPAYQREGL